MQTDFDSRDFKSEILIDFAKLLGHQNNYEEILRLVTKKASDLFNADLALIMMINPRTHDTIKTLYFEDKQIDEQNYHTLNASASGWVIKNELSLISDDIKSDDRFRPSFFKDISARSVVCVPFACENIIIGTLLLVKKYMVGSFNESDLIHLENLAAVVSPFLRNIQKIENYFTSKVPEAALISKYRTCGLLGKSKQFFELLHAVDAAANCDVRVLLEGRSGSGKELVAKAIHNFSKRNVHPFIAIDCGSIPENLIESELFGHVKGAFTGASTARTGLFEEANNGTLFMDEIANLPLELQVKLLRVLQEGEIKPLGSNTTRKINVRVITAASVSLKELVNQKKFREDLFYRLMVYPIHIPSLEERNEDIILLANHFLEKFSKEQHKKAEIFHEEILEFMKHHPWTGNVRELENFVERMIALVPENKKQIDVSILPAEFKNELQYVKKNKSITKTNLTLPETLTEKEREIMRQALIDHNWNQSSAAAALGIHESTLRYKIRKYKLKI
jgi:Nif-specific regulatory protein